MGGTFPWQISEGVFLMARKTKDPSHAELKTILQGMLDRDEDITARAVTRCHSALKNASDITRSDERKTLLDEAQAKQVELRKWAGRVRSTGPAVAAEKLQAAEARIHELEADEEARIASHVAMIQAVAELGGTAKLLKFYGAFSSVRDRLAKQGALPSSIAKDATPTPIRK
jgi:hypothetical protein